MKFREDIQGLRALAVLAVVLYHADVSFVPAGFLGVDIFFVISGYLISHIIISEQTSGTFSFGQFYLRRIRRLVPASVAAVILTLATALFVFGATDLAEAGRTGLHALLFSSNIIFWMDAGYFDAEAHTKPFLHFWSLSVEEQFYLVWPIFIAAGFALLRRIGVACLVVIASCLSLAAAEYLYDYVPAATFFLMPFRVFEFGIGALIAVLNCRIPWKWLQNVTWAFGFALMIASICLLSDTNRMPGLISLIPLIGCGLCIISPDAKVSVILRNQITTSIGNASYSIYLAHWPPVVFYKYVTGEHLQLSAQAGLIVIGILLGYILYFAIERPLRQERFWGGVRPNPGRIITASLGGIATIYLSASIWAANTRQIQPATASQYATPDKMMTTDIKVLRAEVDQRLDTTTLRPSDKNMKNILIIGDSHGIDFTNALSFVGKANIRHENVEHWCQPVVGTRPDGLIRGTGKPASEIDIRKCEARVSEILDGENLKTADLVVLAPKITPWAVEFLTPTLEAIHSKADAPVICVGRALGLSGDVYRIAEQSNSVAEITSAANEQVEFFETLNLRVREISETSECRFLDRATLMCPNGICEVVDPSSNQLLYRDKDHLTVAGAAFLADKISKCEDEACELIKDAMKPR